MVINYGGVIMNGVFLAIVKVAKLLYPFVKESIFGQDSVLTLLRKRKVFLFVVMCNFALFLISAFLTEQNLIFLDKVKTFKVEVKNLEENNEVLTVRNSRLLGLLKGDLDEVCYAHLFHDKLDLVPLEIREKILNSSYTLPKVKPESDQPLDAEEPASTVSE